jgi:transcriptional regulator with XRE-family HTH domain
MQVSITKYRKRAGLSQAELAAKLNVAQTTVSGWERGYREPDNKTLDKLSEILGVSIDSLLHGIPDNDSDVEDMISKHQYPNMTTFDDYPEIVQIARIADKMTNDQRRRMLTIIENAFPHATDQARNPD